MNDPSSGISRRRIRFSKVRRSAKVSFGSPSLSRSHEHRDGGMSSRLSGEVHLVSVEFKTGFMIGRVAGSQVVWRRASSLDVQVSVDLTRN